MSSALLGSAKRALALGGGGPPDGGVGTAGGSGILSAANLSTRSELPSVEPQNLMYFSAI